MNRIISKVLVTSSFIALVLFVEYLFVGDFEVFVGFLSNNVRINEYDVGYKYLYLLFTCLVYFSIGFSFKLLTNRVKHSIKYCLVAFFIPLLSLLIIHWILIRMPFSLVLLKLILSRTPTNVIYCLVGYLSFINQES